MSRATPQKIIAIDWSGRIDESGQRRHIYAAIWTPTGVTLEAGRTREEVCECLIAKAKRTPRLVAGIDCCFSYPAWFLAEQGCATVVDFWRKVAAGQGERWLARSNRDSRFWGKPTKKPVEFRGENMHRMMRLTDLENKISAEIALHDPVRAARVAGIAPKSTFQIGGAGSVGTATLRGIPTVLRLHDAGWRIWPFDAAKADTPLLIEMYARLLTGAVKKSNPDARRKYLARKRKADAAYRKLSRKVIQQAVTSEDAFDALICVMEMAAHRREFSSLKATRDPIRRLEGITWIPGMQAAGIYPPRC
jgi:hypothetical protein